MKAVRVLLPVFLAALLLAAPAAAIGGEGSAPAAPARPAPDANRIGFWEGALLGVVQGVGEFLPVSSSGHLAVGHYVTGKERDTAQMRAFDVAVHLATLLAMLLYFWPDVVSLFGRRQKLILWILLGSVPAGAVGLLFHKPIEAMGDSMFLVGAAFIANGFILIGSNYFGVETRRLEDMTWLDSLIIGLAQAVGITPGISRSGATITSGMVCGLHREEAFTFSFLLGMPAIAGAAALKFREIGAMAFSDSWPGLAAGFVTALLVGLGSISLLGLIVKKRNLLPFGLYTIAFGIAVILYRVYKG